MCDQHIKGAIARPSYNGRHEHDQVTAANYEFRIRIVFDVHIAGRSSDSHELTRGHLAVVKEHGSRRCLERRLDSEAKDLNGPLNTRYRASTVGRIPPACAKTLDSGDDNELRSAHGCRRVEFYAIG